MHSLDIDKFCDTNRHGRAILTTLWTTGARCKSRCANRTAQRGRWLQTRRERRVLGAERYCSPSKLPLRRGKDAPRAQSRERAARSIRVRPPRHSHAPTSSVLNTALQHPLTRPQPPPKLRALPKSRQQCHYLGKQRSFFIRTRRTTASRGVVGRRTRVLSQTQECGMFWRDPRTAACARLL